MADILATFSVSILSAGSAMRGISFSQANIITFVSALTNVAELDASAVTVTPGGRVREMPQRELVNIVSCGFCVGMGVGTEAVVTGSSGVGWNFRPILTPIRSAARTERMRTKKNVFRCIRKVVVSRVYLFLCVRYVFCSVYSIC